MIPRLLALAVLGLAIGGALLSAQDEGSGRSGPKEGAFLPKPFDCYSFNGPNKGRYHSLVCRYALSPTVLVFAREPREEGKDAALDSLLKRLEEATAEFKKHELNAAVVFLSPDAQSSATNPTEADPAKLVEEAKKRDALFARMSARAENLKGVDVAVFPAEGPKGYDLSAKADVSVIFYWKLRVVLSRGYDSGKLGEEEIDSIMAKVKETLEPVKKK